MMQKYTGKELDNLDTKVRPKQDINALIPVHMVPLPPIQYPRMDSIAFDVFVPPPLPAPLGDLLLTV